MIYTSTIDKKKPYSLNLIPKPIIIILPLETKLYLGIFCCYSNLVKEAKSHGCMILSMVTRWSAKFSSHIYIWSASLHEWRNNREVADSRTAAIFIQDTAYFHCDSLNYESHFIEENMSYPIWKCLAYRSPHPPYCPNSPFILPCLNSLTIQDLNLGLSPCCPTCCKSRWGAWMKKTMDSNCPLVPIYYFFSMIQVWYRWEFPSLFWFYKILEICFSGFFFFFKPTQHKNHCSLVFGAKQSILKNLKMHHLNFFGKSYLPNEQKSRFAH